MRLLSNLFLLVLFIPVTACSKAMPIDSKAEQKEIIHNCQILYTEVKKGRINEVKKLIKEKTQKNQLTCIKYAIQQKDTTGNKKQFQAFRYLVEVLIKMKLPDQQNTLTKVLQDYAIVYLAEMPEYTEYLLSTGALPKMPNKYGKLPVATALWAANDHGSCKTPRLLINASNSKILSVQNKAGETALMQSVDKGLICSNELKLLAKKSADLNLVDQYGNTALHYLLMQMNKNMGNNDEYIFPSDIDVLHILLNRGASTQIPNKKSITPAQLLHKLKKKGCKC